MAVKILNPDGSVAGTIDDKTGRISTSGSSGSTATSSSSSTDTSSSQVGNSQEEETSEEQSLVTQFADDYNSFLEEIKENTELSYEAGKTYYDDNAATLSDLASRGTDISRTLHATPGTSDELLNAIDEVNSNITQLIRDFRSVQEDYSQYESEEAFTTAKNQYEWQQKYAGKDSRKLESILADMEDGAEKEWLKSYRGYVDYEEKKNLDVDAYDRATQMLQRRLDNYDPDIDWTDTNARQEVDAEIEKRGSQIDNRRAYSQAAKLIQEKEAQRPIYEAITQKADFDQFSTFDKDTDNPLYQYINADEQGQRRIERYSDSKQKSELAQNAYDNLTEDEKKVYNYLVNTGDNQGAEDYLTYLREDLNYRKAEEKFASDLEDKVLQEYVFAAQVGLEQFELGMEGFAKGIKGDDSYVAPTYKQYASGMAREDLADKGFKLPEKLGGASAGQAGYDIITTSANMAPSILASTAIGFVNPTAGAWAGKTLLGASAAGNAYQEAINGGYTKDEARGYGLAVGASEVILESILGGISEFGGNKLGNAAIKNLDAADGALKMLGKKLGGSFLSEFGEEYLQEVLSPVIRNAILGTHEKTGFLTSEALYAGILGGMTSFIMEGPMATGEVIGIRNTGKQLQKAGISNERLAELGKTFSADTLAYKLAGKVNENTDAFTLGRLFNEIGASLSQQNKTDITNALLAEGMDLDIARKNAEVFGWIMEGKEVSEVQMKMIQKNDVLAKVAKEVLVDENSTVNQRTRGYAEVAQTMSGRSAQTSQTQATEAQQAAGGQKQTKAESTDSKKETSAKSSYDLSGNGKTTYIPDGKEVKIKEIASVEKGKMTLKLEDGRTVDSKDIGYADSSEALVYESVAKMDVNAAAANVLVNAYNAASGVSAEVYVHGIKEAYRYGEYGYPADLAANGPFSSMLTPEQRNTAYKLGKMFSGKQVAKEQAEVRKAKDTGKTTANPAGKGGVFFEGSDRSVTEWDSYANKPVLKPTQETAIQTMKVLSKALGIKFYVGDYSNRTTKGGKSINGFYDPKDGSIHIDLNAGMDSQKTMLFTLGHELTHFIRQWSPAKFKVLANFLMREFSNHTNMDAWVMEKMKQTGLDYDEAFEEVVADAMEAMLTDGKVVEKLAKLKQQDKGLWQKIKDFIDNWAAKLKEAYKGLKPDSAEGKAVLEMTDKLEEIQQLFAEGLVEASENYQAAEQIGLEVDSKTESVAPDLLYSEKTWTESDYVQERNKAAKEISKAIGVSEKKAKAYIDSVNSIAKMIAEDRVRLDYFSSPNRSSFVGNVEYGGSFDFSTLCKKRRLLTGTFTAIQKALPNTALTANEILDIRNRMKKAGLEVSCGLCYVEGSRANMGQFAKEFLRLYKEYHPDAWQPNMADVNTPEGIEWVRINHPECYEQYEYFWNHYGTLKSGDKNLFASQQKPKLYQLHTEYKGEILQKFKNDDNVEAKNLNGGIRLQSFSDFEIVHLIDTMQIIMDMSRVGLAGQAYTKVPDFAWALGDTGLKINLSLIAKGVDENGKLIFDDVEGMPIGEAMRLRDRYSANVGTILVAFNDAQLMAAMADDRVDYIIPFHRSQWKKSQYEAMGLPAKTKDYTYMQNEKFIKPQYHEYRGRMVQDKATNYMPNEYWDFSKSGKENAISYLEMCARNNKRPKFYKLLQNNGDGSYSLKADGSTDGYWKLLIDFKMYDNDGNGSPQMPVKPEFNMEESTRMLEEYRGGHSNFPVAQGIVDEFVQEYKDNHKGIKYSVRDYAAAIDRGDMGAAQRMVDEAAKQAGYNSGTLYHGTPKFGFTWFDLGRMDDGISIFATSDKKVAETYSGKTDRYQISDRELKNVNEMSGSELLKYVQRYIDPKYELATDSQRRSLRNIYAEALGDVRQDIIQIAEDNSEKFTQERLSKIYEIADILAEMSNTKDSSKLSDLYNKFVDKTDELTLNDPKVEKLLHREYRDAFSSGTSNFISDSTTQIYQNILEISKPDSLFIIIEENTAEHLPADIARKQLKGRTENGIYSLYAKTDNMFTFDAGDVAWNKLDGKHIGVDGITSTREVAKHAKDAGYNGVIIRNVRDNNGLTNYGEASDIYIFFDNKKVKSADAVTYDDSGKVIPLSERFNAEKTDIRYSSRDTENLSNRSLLMRVDESSLEHPVEAKRLREYKETVAKADAEEQVLQELNEKISGELNQKRLKQLRFEANKSVNRLANLDKQILQKEAGLKTVLEREQAKTKEQNKRKRKDVYEEYRINTEVEHLKTMREYRATREELHGLQDETKVMEKEFVRIVKEYEKLSEDSEEQKTEDKKTISDLRNKLKEEAKKHKDEGDKWAKKFTELLKEYDAAGREITKLEAKIQQQRQSAKTKVDNRKKTEMRQKIRKVIRDLDKILNRGDKKRNVKEGMKDFVAEALNSAEVLFIEHYSNEDMVLNGVETDMTAEEAKLFKEAQQIMNQLNNLPTGYDGWMARQEQEFKLKAKLNSRMAKLKDVFIRERERLNRTTVSTVLGNLADAYGKLQNSEQEHVQGAYHEAVHEYLKMLQEDIGGTVIKDMTLDQLEELYKAYTMVMTTVRNANKMFAENLNATRDALAKNVMREVRTVGGERKLWWKFGDKVNSFSWNNEKPVYAFERIGSATLKTMYGNIRKGQDTWAIDLQEANDFRQNIWKKYNYSKWDRSQEFKFTSSSGIDFELNLEQIMSIYAYSKRAQAYDHLMRGGFVFDDGTEVKVTKYKIPLTFLKKNATAYNLSYEILEDIISKLTPEQRAFVDEMQDYLSSTMGEKGNEVSMRLYGVKMFNEQFYFPLRSAGQYMERAKEADLKKEQGQVNLVNSGFAKATKIKASNPVVLSGFMEVWASHVNEMSMYHSFVLPMEDFRRVYNYSTPHTEEQQSASVNGVIQNAYGKAATDYIDQLYRDLNGGALTDNRTGFINAAMGLFKKGAVFASWSVTIQQPSAIARATALIDSKYFIGTRVDAKKRDKTWAEVKQYAPVATIKEMGFFDTNMGRSATDFLTSQEYTGIVEMAKAFVTDGDYRDEMLSKAPALADEITWCAIWEAVKRETKDKHKNMDVKSEAFLRLAGERFSEVIDKTQVYDSVLARSANMRSKDTGMKMATAFMAEPTTSINMVMDALRKGKQGDKKQARRIIGSVVASVLLNSFLVAWVYAARDDDEDETYREKYLSSFVSGIVDGVNPMTYIPFLKDIVSIVQGYEVERSDMAVISDLWNAYKQLKSDDVSAWRKVEGFAGSICQIFGLPVKNIMRDLRSVYQAYDTVVNGEENTVKGNAYAIVEGLTGKKPSNSKQLYDARVKGDEAHAERVEGRYDDEDSANAAVRKEITGLYMDDKLTQAQATMQLAQYAGMKPDEAYWLMDGWKYKKEQDSDEGYSKYGAFYEAVQTGKDLKAVIQTYMDNGVKKETLSGQLTEHFKEEYIAKSASERSAMKGYLLNAYEQVGVNRLTAEEKLKEWDFEAKHGSSYDQMVKDYKAGEITESNMRKILQERGYNKSDIEDKIFQWNTYKKYGYEYSELDDAYRAGELSRSEFRQAMINNGTFPAKADQAIKTYDWMRDHPQYDLAYADAAKYALPIENYGRSLSDVNLKPETYLQYKELKTECKGVDNNNDGVADSGTKRDAIFAMINRLPISNNQKDALAAIDYSMNSIKKNAPWHK